MPGQQAGETSWVVSVQQINRMHKHNTYCLIINDITHYRMQTIHSEVAQFFLNPIVWYCVVAVTNVYRYYERLYN